MTRVNNQAQGRKGGNVEKVGFLRVSNFNDGGPKAVGLGPGEVGEEEPLVHVLVTRVVKGGDVRDGRSTTREGVVLDDAVGELVGEIVHKNLDFAGKKNGIFLGRNTTEVEQGRRRIGVGVGIGGGKRSVEESGEEGIDGEEEEDGSDKGAFEKRRFSGHVGK